MATIVKSRHQVTPTRPRRWRSLRIAPLLYGALALTLFFGVIQVAQRAGFWATSGKLTPSGEQVQVTGADPNEVKGWMTIEAVLTAYNVPQEQFYTRFKIPAEVPTSAALKDLEALAPDFSVKELRSWLAERDGP